MKKIYFNKINENTGITGHTPAPAARSIPEWFRKMPKFREKISSPTFDGIGNADLTIKACPPFLDALTSGYMIYTEFDMNVSWEDGYPVFEWRSGGDLISTHHEEQIVAQQVPEGFSKQPLKFNNLWQIITPKGYSTLFTHPLNRNDLPFSTISGVVETDRYKNIINFPFVIKENFEGIIPAGTPIVQLFPFKRESWAMELGSVTEKTIMEESTKLNHKLLGSYKAQWWTRKEYR